MVFCVFGDVILMVDELYWSRYRFKFNVPTFRSYKFLRCPVWVSLGPWPVSPQTLWKVMPHYICWSFCLSVGLFVHVLVSLSVVLHQWIVDHGHSLHNHSERSCLIPSVRLSVGLFVHLLISLSVVLYQWRVDYGLSLHNHCIRSCLIPSVGWSVCWSVLLLVSLSVCLSFLRFVSLSVDTCVPETTALASVSSM